MKALVRVLIPLALAAIGLVTIFQNCSGMNGAGSSATPVTTSAGGGGPTSGPSPYVGKNTFPLNVNGCGSDYTNTPCVSVTICVPNTSQCVTVNNIVFDTGSTGLRIFGSALGNLNLPTIGGPTSTLAECYEYGDGTYGYWGTINTADVQLGGEKASSVPIQVINAAYATLPAGCELGAFADAQSAGFNGTMGVMSYVQDCGSECVTNTSATSGTASDNLYYTCNGANCSPSTAAIANQTTNPIAMMPFDNNGYNIQLSAPPTAGSASLAGVVTMGIGTQTNNTPPSGLTVVALNATFSNTFGGGGLFISVFNNLVSAAIIDTGTDKYELPSTATAPDCAVNSAFFGFLCPVTTQTLTAQFATPSAAAAGTVTFEIENPNLLGSSPLAAPNIAADNGETAQTAGLDIWGLPFFFGRTVYIGLENAQSSLGSGQLFAY